MTSNPAAPFLFEKGIASSRILNMERALKIPEFLAHLKIYGGYPVPFTQLWASDKPDFRAVDLEHCARCLRDRLCAICGRRLGEYCYFIGGPLSKKNRLFVDPAMQAMRGVRLADLRFSEWAETRIL